MTFSKLQRNSQLKDQIHKSLVNKFQQICDFRELQTLHKVINDNEVILQAVNGLVPGNNNGTGLVILTQKRVIFFNHRLFVGITAPSIPLSKINSVTPKTHLIHGSILFDNGAQTFTVHNILAWKCDKFVDAVDQAIETYVTDPAKANDHPSHSNEPSSNDADQLSKLHSLLKNGTLSPEEFQHEKAKIINN